MKRGGRKRRIRNKKIVNIGTGKRHTAKNRKSQLRIMACDARPVWGGPYNVALVGRFFPDRNVRTRSSTWPPLAPSIT